MPVVSTVYLARGWGAGGGALQVGYGVVRMSKPRKTRYRAIMAHFDVFEGVGVFSPCCTLKRHIGHFTRGALSWVGQVVLC